MRAFVSTVPFAETDQTPLRLLEQAGIEYVINPIGRKLREAELAELIRGFDALIAGTEAITKSVLSHADNLKLIARVGIGLDGVDLHAARDRGIRVCYTPDAPAKAVADLTIGLMLTLLRKIHVSNGQMHEKKWHRFLGRRLGDVTVGLIGVGRVGTGVIGRLQGFGGTRILVNDIRPNHALDTAFNLQWVEKETIYREADVISVHVPLGTGTHNMISRPEIAMMKPSAVLINTARGGIVNEADLYAALLQGRLSGAAMDVFEQEPYEGPLSGVERCLLTAHMGSMSVDCRARMEIEATEEVVRLSCGQELLAEVPEVEYLNQGRCFQ